MLILVMGYTSEKGRAMQRSRVAVTAMICGFFLLMALYGCGGGDENNENDRHQVTSTSIDVTKRVLNVVLGTNTGVTQGQLQATDRTQGEGIPRQQVNETFACDTGQVSFAGDVTGAQNFTFNGTMTFANCDGMNGAVTVNVMGTISGSQIADTQITLTVTLHGSVSAEGCTITFHAFSIGTTADAFGTITSPLLASGVLSATCDGESISCTLNNVDLNHQAVFTNSCHS
jgi:hypothetical protein